MKTSPWKLVAEEPYRLLFPLGTVFGIFGVLMWPMYAWNIVSAYPGPAHAHIMIQGFLTCFVIGFLGTAFPRLLDVPRMRLEETLAFAVSLTWIVWLHYTERTFWANQLFFFTLLALVLGLFMRSFFRKDTPPPGFTLVAMGILSALAGAAIQAFDYLGSASELAVPMARLLLYQGYLLFPIMGIGAFLLPRFFGLPNRQEFPTSVALPAGWKSRALFAFGCGAVILISFLAEATGYLRLGFGLRASAVLVYFYCEVPAHREGVGGGTLALGLRVALVAIPVGYLLMAIWPERAFSFLHVVLITGFSLLTLIVASRVVFGHSGNSHLFRASLRSILILISMLTVAMITRVTADWMPGGQLMHYAYAAVFWVIGVTIWGLAILPGVCVSEPED